MRINKDKFILGANLFLFLVSGCATIPEKLVHKIPLTDMCQRYDVECEWDEISYVITLKKNHRKAKALLGSDTVVMGTERILLSEPLTRERKTILVPYDFKKKVIDRLVPIRIKGPYKVVIDPGHGGKDPGATGRKGTKEKKIVLDIAKRLKKDLEKRKINVVMTRSKDKFISLEKRTEIASSEKADLFVSIHANASKAKRARGIEIWSTRPLKEEERDDAQRQKNQKILFNNLSMTKKDPRINEIVADMLYGYQQYESHKLASYVAKGLCLSVGARNRGSKKSGFFVLRNNLMPAILVEVGFLSDSREEKQLNNSAYRQRVAESLAGGIIEYVGTH